LKRAGKQNITLADIKTKLAQKNINFGVFSDSFLQSYIDKNHMTFSIARSVLPQKSNTGFIKYFFKESIAELGRDRTMVLVRASDRKGKP
jgi:hypothetical protein